MVHPLVKEAIDSLEAIASFVAPKCLENVDEHSASTLYRLAKCLEPHLQHFKVGDYTIVWRGRGFSGVVVVIARDAVYIHDPLAIIAPRTVVYRVLDDGSIEKVDGDEARRVIDAVYSILS